MRILWVLGMVLGLTLQLEALSLEEQLVSQEAEIKQLKRELAIKEQEIKILLITLKNAQEETILSSSGQKLEFATIDQVSPTRVVLKPSMLSETAIKEINKLEQTDTDTLSQTTDEKPQQAATMDANSMDAKLPPMEYIKASKFELMSEAKVYSEIGDTTFTVWPQGTRFTSNRKRGNWILVTGQITSKGWKRSDENFWVPQEAVRIIP